MVRLTRRTAVKLAGSSLALSVVGTAVSAQSNVETVVEIPSEQKTPENLAIDDDGTLYFGITAGEVWQLTADQTGQTGLTLDDLTRIASLPGSVIGVEVGPEGTLFVASQADAGTGVWRVPRDGGDPALFATVPARNQDEAFPNDVLHDDERNRLLVTESFGGLVYEVPLDATEPETAASVWLDADALDTESFGANGLAFGPDGAVFVAVTRATNDAGENVGRLVRVPVADDGSAADAAVYLEGPSIFGADGITVRNASVYVAANSLNEVVRVTADERTTIAAQTTANAKRTTTGVPDGGGPDERTTTIASSDDGLVFPSDVVFGTDAQQQDDLFICNFANENPTEGAILRTTVG